MRICVAGAYGAFGLKHLDALKNIEDIEGTQKVFNHRAEMCSLASKGEWSETLEKA